jgi:hypothetical protein
MSESSPLYVIPRETEHLPVPPRSLKAKGKALWKRVQPGDSSGRADGCRPFWQQGASADQCGKG